MIASPEDVILSKLEWSRIGESERQFRDASNLYSVKKAKLDEAYLDRWAEELDVTDLLAAFATLKSDSSRSVASTDRS